MAHIPGHVGPGGQTFQGQLAPEFQGAELLRSVSQGIEPRRQQLSLRTGQLARTRQLSPAQEAVIISRGQEAQSQALVNAQIRADFERARQVQRERLIAERRQFATEEEQRIFRRNRALLEQQQSQGLLGSIFGNIAGLGGRALGAGLGGPVGALAGGPPGVGSLPPLGLPNLAQDVGGFEQGLSF